MSKGRDIKALLFDFDGTIVESEGPAYRSWQELYAEHGHELEMSDWAGALGTLGGFDAIAHLEALIGAELPERDDLVTRRRLRKRRLVEAEGFRAGVERYLADAEELGLMVAIVTSDSNEWIDWNLKRLGRSEGWACIHCADGDRAKAKPDPYLYLAALASLGFDADQAIAIEDSPNGVAAAKAAGLFCVAVPNAITGQLDLSDADVILGSLEDLPLEELLAGL
jgi:HAD superfamily hydrolase (TIGR01509 family)